MTQQRKNCTYVLSLGLSLFTNASPPLVRAESLATGTPNFTSPILRFVT